MVTETSLHAWVCILAREAAPGVEVILGMSSWFEPLLSLGSVSFAVTVLPVFVFIGQLLAHQAAAGPFQSIYLPRCQPASSFMEA